MVDLTKALRAAVCAAVAGGAEILDVYGESDFQIERKEDDSPLTIADKKSNDAIQSLLSEFTSDTPILSEEGRSIQYEERRKWEEFWMIDPLDGTKEFIKRNGEFTVNIALMQRNKPVVGVVYVPVTDVLYYGARGVGSFRIEKGSKTSVSFRAQSGKKLPSLMKDRAEKDNSGAQPPIRVVASRSHFTTETAAFVRQLERVHGAVETVNAGSAVKICLVAEGSADVYPRFAPTMEWDIAAGVVVAEEAGCSVRQAEATKPMVFNKEDLVNPWFIVGRHPFV